MATRNRRSDKEKLLKRRRRRRLAFAALGCAFLILCYMGGDYYFQKHFFPGTVLNGVDCSFKKTDQAFDMLSEDLGTYSLSILSEDGKLALGASDVGLKYANDKDVKTVMEEQDHHRWIMNLHQKKVHTILQRQLDDETMKTSVEALACMNPSKPRESQNASIIYNKKDSKFEVKYGAYGNIIDEDKFLEGVKESILNKTEILDLSCNKYYKEPKYTSKSKKLNQSIDTLNKFLEMKIHYQDGDTTLDISKERMSKFIKWDKNYTLKLDEKAIGQYVKERISKKFDETKSLHILDTPSSGKIYVANGQNGQRAVDVPKEKKQLIAAIKKGKNVSLKPIYVKEYLYSSNGAIVKKDYVDINLSRQRVCLVLNNKIIVDTPCVSGNTSAGRGSPTGIYRIAFKMTEYTMVKYNAFVHYWMPYDTSVGIGLHDATWRSAGEFGGNTYTYNGSHGCINLPLSAAADIYHNTYTGIPVIVHW